MMHASWADLEAKYIAQAIRIWHHLGAEEFIARTRFKESRRYVVLDGGEHIASKPLLAMAFQLQFSVGPEGPPRLNGGEQTREILRRLGYELLDGFDGTAPGAAPQVAVARSTNFWWVNQTVNFKTVYDEGSLWAPFTNSAGHRVDHWQTLEQALPGDIVFHYVSPNLRGMSRIAAAAVPSLPPRGYDDVPIDTPGRLVLTEPLGDISISRDRAQEILKWGQGPLNSAGTVRNGYLFPLERSGALELLHLSDRDVMELDGDEERGSSELPEFFVGGPSDRLALVAVRAEQRYLRKQQPRRWDGACSLCGRRLPEELLVGATSNPAGHAPKTSAWIPATYPCSRVFWAAMRSSNAATSRSTSRGPSRGVRAGLSESTTG